MLAFPISPIFKHRGSSLLSCTFLYLYKKDTLKKAICLQSFAPVRKEPGDRSEMVTQLLFGETVSLKVSQPTNSFLEIIADADGYEGWVDIKNLETLSFKDYDSLLDSGYKILSCNFVPAPHPCFRGQLVLSSGSIIYGVWEEKMNLNAQCINLRMAQEIRDPSFFKEKCLSWLEIPYLWGGKSCFGVDCSGFTQNLLRQWGKNLPRDASQQAQEGVKIDSVDHAKTGDLAFFGNEGKVTHTGIILDPGRIIHASGKVRYDHLDNEGIHREDSKMYTHHLWGIRRYNLVLQ